MIRWMSVTLGALLIIGVSIWFFVQKQAPETPPVSESLVSGADSKPAQEQMAADEASRGDEKPDEVPFGAIRLTSVTDLDPDLRGDIREAMTRYIDSKTIDGKFVWVEPEKKLPIGLVFSGLHEELYSHGNYYLSCAEFSTGTGYVVDLDIVTDVRNGMVVATNDIFHEMRPEKEPAAAEPRNPSPQ